MAFWMNIHGCSCPFFAKEEVQLPFFLWLTFLQFQFLPSISIVSAQAYTTLQQNKKYRFFYENEWFDNLFFAFLWFILLKAIFEGLESCKALKLLLCYATFLSESGTVNPFYKHFDQKIFEQSKESGHGEKSSKKYQWRSTQNWYSKGNQNFF